MDLQAFATEIRSSLVEIEGESRLDRYRRLERVMRRIDMARCGFQPWEDGSKELGALYREVFKFSAFGVK